MTESVASISYVTYSTRKSKYIERMTISCTTTGRLFSAQFWTIFSTKKV
jgi:hypothetical protein